MWTFCWSPNGKQVASVLFDTTVGADGKNWVKSDPEVSHPRIALIDLKTGKHRILKLKVMDGLTFYPSSAQDWR